MTEIKSLDTESFSVTKPRRSQPSDVSPTIGAKHQPSSAKHSTIANKPWHVYLLECKDGSFYTGVTNDLDKRMKAHAHNKGSKYVMKKGFKCLLRSKECKDKSDACKAEYKIKQLQKWDKLDWFNQ